MYSTVEMPKLITQLSLAKYNPKILELKWVLKTRVTDLTFICNDCSSCYGKNLCVGNIAEDRKDTPNLLLRHRCNVHYKREIHTQHILKIDTMSLAYCLLDVECEILKEASYKHQGCVLHDEKDGLHI